MEAQLQGKTVLFFKAADTSSDALASQYGITPESVSLRKIPASGDTIRVSIAEDGARGAFKAYLFRDSAAAALIAGANARTIQEAAEPAVPEPVEAYESEGEAGQPNTGTSDYFVYSEQGLAAKDAELADPSPAPLPKIKGPNWALVALVLAAAGLIGYLIIKHH